jgi:hypothetical protein
LPVGVAQLWIVRPRYHVHFYMNIDEKIQEIEVSIAQRGVETSALKDLILLVAEEAKISKDGLDLIQYLDKQEKKHWDSFLLFVEKHRPELAAAIDKRKIDEIPTD